MAPNGIIDDLIKVLDSFIVSSDFSVNAPNRSKTPINNPADTTIKLKIFLSSL